MSGIAGIWNRDGCPVDPSILSRMNASLCHRGPDGISSRVSGSIAFTHQHLWVTPEEMGEVQPLVGGSGTMLAIDGRLDNRDELISALSLPQEASDAACVMAAYDSWREQFAVRLNGDFAIAIYHESRRQLLLARDGIGARPLYYFCADRLFAFASEIKALLAHDDIETRPDDEGLADYMLLSARPMDRQEVTCFKNVLAVVPGHLVIVTADRAVTRRYWDFDTGRSLRLRSVDEYVEAFRERFAAAVRRRIRSTRPVAVSVSGGLDSSSIFCVAENLRRQGRVPCPEIAGLSYYGEEGTDADERRYLVDLERQYAVQIERICIEPLLGLVNGLERQVAAIEAPFVNHTWGVTEELHRHARARGARILLYGTWGDQVLFSCGYLIDLFNGLRWTTIRRHLREYGEWIGRSHARALGRRLAFDLLRHHVPRRVAPPLKRIRLRLFPPGRPKHWFSDGFLQTGLRFADQLAAIGDGFHSAQAKALYVEARSKYHVHCLEWSNKVGALLGVDVAVPFLDRDLLAFLMAIPGEIQNLNGVPRGLLRESMKGILPEPVRRRTWKGTFSAAVNKGVASDLPAIARALSSDCLGVRLGYLDAARLSGEVAKLSAALSRPDCEASWNLADLFGFETWLQVFLRDHGRPVLQARSVAGVLG
jgi:asparagine synthase (glutamine-hydrolysing)